MNEAGAMAAVAAGFEERFGRPPQDCLFSPGRVNLIGEHIDYCGGLVLPMAISRGTWFAWAGNATSNVRIHSTRFDETVTVDPEVHTSARGHWSDYAAGVLRYLGADAGADIYVSDDIACGGLSSSASFCVGIARALTAVAGRDAATDEARLEIAQICRRAENEFVGVPCGIMDQVSVALGGIVQLDCADLEYERLAADFGEACIAVIDTGKPRTLAASKYRERLAEVDAICDTLGNGFLPSTLCRRVTERDLAGYCVSLEPVLQRRLRHLVAEQARVLQAVEALRTGDYAAFGQLMILSHVSLRDDYMVTGPELDAVVAASLDQPGVLGARMTGAGFGGCAIALVAEHVLEDFTEAVRDRYWRETGLEANVFTVQVA